MSGRVVEGYWFASDREAELARVEAGKVNFLEERMNYDNPQSVYAVYQKAIDNRVFQTPVGVEYLRKLQSYLNGQDLTESIRDIPAYTYVAQGSNRQREEAALKHALKQAENRVHNTEKRFRISVLLNIGLAVLVAAMFLITVSSSNANILNYKRAIQNEYAAWEQELAEREQIVRDKEKELNIEGE